MARYDNLPVYKTSYDLLLQLFKLNKNLDRDFRFTIGESLKNEMVQLIINVYRANCRDKKDSLIASAIENLEVSRLLLRLLQDLKQIGVNEFVVANEKIESISKQLVAWRKSQAKKYNTGQEEDIFQGESSEGMFPFRESAC